LKRTSFGLLVAGMVGALGFAGCVSGGQVRADAEVLQHDIQRARRSGAMKCAPAQLASAEANIDFAQGYLSEGRSTPAADHVHQAEASIKEALELSKGCGPKEVVIRNPLPPPDQGAVVVKIDESDSDGDGIADKDDKCAKQAEDKDGFQDDDGCPDLDNDADGVLDANDTCPDVPGAVENKGCPLEKPQDQDGDGVSDSQDKCPGQPEDRDGFQDTDGCPDTDNDGDGLVDAVDRCPNAAGPVQSFGCPVVDRDTDGVSDSVDKCPEEPEDRDGFQDSDGCPDLDNDADGVPDARDRCPNVVGPVANQGCPVPDRDGDGIPDTEDKCPDEYGPAESHGCAKKYKHVVVEGNRIQIKQQIRFRTNSAKISGKLSYTILGEVAAVLRDNPRIKKVRIEGHTDSVGSDAHNLKLSQERADAVRVELITLGVDPARMESVGYGETHPIAPNVTSAGRALNRRTEFNIVQPAPPAPPAEGQGQPKP